MNIGKKTWGLFLILVAILLVFYPSSIFAPFSIWQILFGLLFLTGLLKGMYELDFGAVLFSSAFLIIVFNKELGLTDITPWTVLIAATLGTIGLNIIFPNVKKCFHKVSYSSYKHSNKSTGSTTIESTSDDDENFKIRSSFGDNIKYVNSKNLVYGEIDSSFGSVKVYLDSASLANNEATIHINAVFSGIELYVPKDWTIVNKVSYTLAGLEERNKSILLHAKGENHLTLIGSAAFSGISIIYL